MEFEKGKSLSLLELNKIQKRMKQAEVNIQRHLDFLERSYEECWAYPDREEKSELYSVQICKSEKKIESIKSVLAEIENLKFKINALDI